MKRHLNRILPIAISVFGFCELSTTNPATADMHTRNCGSVVFENDQISDDTLFYLDKNKWVRSNRFEKMPSGQTTLFAYIANDGRELDGGMVLVKVVDFYKGQNIRDRAVKLHRDPYAQANGKSAPKFSGEVDIEKYQRVHAADGRGGDLGPTLRQFHANDYVVKGNETRSTRAKDRKGNFVFEDYELVPSESLLARLFAPRAEAAAKDMSENKKEPDPNKISVNQFSARLKYYSHENSMPYDVVCFSIKARDEATKSKISIRDFEYDGPLRDADPVGRSNKWTIIWESEK
jgi:hypothetical protein